MNENEFDTLLDEVVHEANLKINSWNDDDQTEKNISNNTKVTDENNITKLYQYNEHFSKLCQETNINHLSTKNGKDFLCSACRSYFFENLFYCNDKCSLCSNQSDLNLLHVLEHKMEYLLCEICDKAFKNLDVLYEHINSEHNFIVYNCFCCDEIFRLKYNIIYHLIFEHKLNKKNSITKLIDYKCMHCNIILNRSAVKSHLTDIEHQGQPMQLIDDTKCMICKNTIEENL